MTDDTDLYLYPMGCSASKPDPSKTFSPALEPGPQPVYGVPVAQPIATYPAPSTLSAPPYGGLPVYSEYPEASTVELRMAEAVPVAIEMPAYYEGQPSVEYNDGPLLTVMQKYQIGPQYLEDLRKIRRYNIAVLIDDSSSMNAPSTSPAGTCETRWSELSRTVMLAVDLGAALDANGLDLWPIHAPVHLGISSQEQVQEFFRTPPPRGQPTPIKKTFEDLLRYYDTKKQPLLVLIATDGEPTDASANRGELIPASKKLKVPRLLRKYLVEGQYLKKETSDFIEAIRGKKMGQVFVSVLACTDKEEEIGWLNILDAAVPGVDVLDDYYSELEEVRKGKGPLFPYTFGDHVARYVLGSVFSKYDTVDGF